VVYAKPCGVWVWPRDGEFVGAVWLKNLGDLLGGLVLCI
jgi:hypothetical protein